MSFRKGLLRSGAVILACGLITGCGDVLKSINGGGGGGETTTLGSVGPDGRPGPATGRISGVAMEGRLAGADVRVFNFDTGAKGEILASGQVDPQGRYDIDLTVRSQPVLIEISGGRYVEPASATTVALSNGQVLLAVQNYPSGSTMFVSPTYYTTLAAGLAESMIRMGAASPQAVIEANRRIPAIAGLAAGFDAVAAAAVDISSPASVTPFVSSELEYGFTTASLSSLTEAASVTANRPVHETINSISFMQLALDDVRRDGVLDGQGTQGALAIGVTPLSADVYRNTLALNVLRMANNPSGNKTSIGPAQVLPLAQRLNNSTDPIYGGRPIIPLNVDAPVIADLSIAPNALLAGTVTLTATATSVFGIASVELLIDNVVVGTASDLAKPSITFDTTTIADGGHQLSIRSADLIGGRTATPAIAITISNAEGRISNISLANNSIVRGTVYVTADIVDGAGIAQVRYFVDDRQPVISTDPKASFMLDTKALRLQDDEGHTLRITAINNLGREIASPTINFNVDNEVPNLVITSPPPGAFLRKRFDLLVSPTDNGALGNLELSIDTLPHPEIIPDSEGFSINSENFRDGPHVLTVRVEDQAGNDAVATLPVTFDNTAPTAMITSPVQNAAIRGPFEVVASFDDAIGLADTAEVQIDSVRIGVLATTNGNATQVDSAQLKDGARSLTVVAVDRAGNTMTSAPVTITVDNTPPKIDLTSAAIDGAGSCVLLGTITDDSNVASASLRTDFPRGVFGRDPSTITTALTTPSFREVLTLPPAGGEASLPLSLFEIRFMIVATDVLGNEVSQPVGIDFGLDNNNALVCALGSGNRLPAR